MWLSLPMGLRHPRHQVGRGDLTPLVPACVDDLDAAGADLALTDDGDEAHPSQAGIPDAGAELTGSTTS